MHFTTDVQISLVNFIKVLGFLLLTPEKKGGHTFLIVYFAVINIYCFFNGHGTWLLLLEYFRSFVQVSEIF